jgi:serine protease Do
MNMSRLNPGRIVPALTIAALMGAASIAALTHGATPAIAAGVPAGGYVDLVARVAPAVVTIEVSKTASLASTDGEDIQPQTPFDDFARRFGLPMPGGDSPAMKGAGTGFVISEDGRIVTNAHVVDGADDVTVTLADGTQYAAKVVGADSATDIAVLKIEATGLTAVTFGASKDLQVGENVVAMGNPFGLGNTVTTGIVSAIGRDINAGPFDNFIQTDAAINKGNSGGPLFNEQGEVIGINTAIVSPTGGSVGIGFAVPSDMASAVVADLSDDGKIQRGWLGVQIQPVSEDVASALGLDAAKGVMIAQVIEDTPAMKAGLRKGDIVTAIDGTAVDGPRDLTRIVAGDAPGKTIGLDLLRAGKPVTLNVTLGDRAEQPA